MALLLVRRRGESPNTVEAKTSIEFASPDTLSAPAGYSHVVSLPAAGRLVWTADGWPAVSPQPWAGDAESDDPPPTDPAALAGTWELVTFDHATAGSSRLPLVSSPAERCPSG